MSKIYFLDSITYIYIEIQPMSLRTTYYNCNCKPIPYHSTVGKQGERGEARVNSVQTRLRTRWRGVKERRSVTTRERGEYPSTSRFTFTTNLFITILIGLKLPTFLFYVWTEDIFLFGSFTGILSIQKDTLR
jgi:hypothetical protein